MKKTALVTGASSGIGLELARVIAKDHYNLVLVARTESKLKQLADELHAKYDTQVLVIPKDLTHETSAEELFEELQKQGIEIDILVNNAGLGVVGRFAETNYARDLEMVKVNVLALVQLTKLFVQGMIVRKRGKIMNIASLAAFQPGPNMAVYFATKSFVLSFSEAIAQELKSSGVTVTAVCPGITQTEFFSGANVDMPVNPLSNWFIQTAAQVAESGYQATKAGKSVHVTGLINNLSAMTAPFVPRQILLPFADILIKSFGKNH
ncbi:MAG: SDR family oxidoreductase [Microscillaceae bacterium]|jgi:hypothetical protein|nr:SDR family oxidoreductase [Microscillaceae bacterium]